MTRPTDEPSEPVDLRGEDAAALLARQRGSVTALTEDLGRALGVPRLEALQLLEEWIGDLAVPIARADFDRAAAELRSLLACVRDELGRADADPRKQRTPMYDRSGRKRRTYQMVTGSGSPPPAR